MEALDLEGVELTAARKAQLIAAGAKMYGPAGEFLFREPKDAAAAEMCRELIAEWRDA